MVFLSPRPEWDEIQDGVNVGGTLAQPGDAIIVTGDVGSHGCTILLAREDFGIEADVTSDCAPSLENRRGSDEHDS